MRRKRVETIQLKEWVSTEFKRLCPEGPRQQNRFYLPAAASALRWLGPMAERKGLHDNMHHVELLVLIAGHAMQILEASNYRAWTAARNLLHFQRMMFLRCMVIGAGFYTRANILQHPAKNTRWAPFHEMGADFFGTHIPKRRESHTIISAPRMEQAVFHHLFPTALAENTDPMASLAVVDSFETPPDQANPICSSLRRGVRKTLLKYRIEPGMILSKWLDQWYPAILNELQSNDLAVEDEPSPEEAAQADSSASGPSGRAERFAAMVQSGVREGKIKVSCPKAPFHGFRGSPQIVWPAGLSGLARQFEGVSEEQLQTWFLDRSWVERDPEGQPATEELAFYEQRGASKIKRASVHMVPLSDGGREALLPTEGIPDNPTIATMEEIAKEKGLTGA